MAVANAISLSINLTVNNGSYSQPKSETGSYTQNTQGGVAGIAVTSTTKSTVDLGSVATLGFLYAKNLDVTNNCQIGLDVSGTFTPFALLKPGEISCFRLMTGITLQLKAVAGTPNIEYWIVQD